MLELWDLFLKHSCLIILLVILVCIHMWYKKGEKTFRARALELGGEFRKKGGLMKEKLLFASGVYHGRKVILQSKRIGRRSKTLVIAKHGRELTPGIFIRHRELKILKKPDDMPSPPWDPKFSAKFVVRGDENLALKIIDPGVVGKFFELDKSEWTKTYTIAVNGMSKAGGEVVFEYGYFTPSKKLLRKAMDLVVDLAEKCEKT